MGINYLKETEELIELLNGFKKVEIALKLKDALDSASTGTELIMAVKFHLENVALDEMPEILRPRVEKLIIGISELLK